MITVERAQEGSIATFHVAADAAYIVGTGGEIAIGSFRGAAALARHETGAELLTNGHFETFAAGVASGWTEDDADSKITPGGDTGYARRLCQAITRDGAGGANATGIRQAVTTVNGTWYRLRVWVKASAAGDVALQVHDGSDAGATHTIAAATTWARHEVWFKAFATTTRIRFCAPSTVGAIAYWDEASLVALAEDSWDHAIEGGAGGRPLDSRTWLDKSLVEGRLRLLEDGTRRTGARLWYPRRASAETWDASVIVPMINGSYVTPIRVRRTAPSEVYTGVVVRYGYDRMRGEYRKSVYIDCRQESTGATVTSFSDYVMGTSADIDPGDWCSDNVLGGTSASVATSDYGTTVTIAGATFQTASVAAGDWFWVYRPIIGKTHLSKITAIVDEDTLTLEDPCFECVVGGGVVNWWSISPCLFRAGGMIFIPNKADALTGGALISFYAMNSNLFEAINFPGQTAAVAGDVVWQLWSDSEDRSAVAGFRDQAKTIGSNRERTSMKRVATLGQARTLTHESQIIQDRETAIALRDHLFDQTGRRWVFETQTDFSTWDREVGDFVTLSHDMVPGGSMVCEIAEQRPDFRSGTIGYRLESVE